MAVYDATTIEHNENCCHRVLSGRTFKKSISVCGTGKTVITGIMRLVVQKCMESQRFITFARNNVCFYDGESDRDREREKSERSKEEKQPIRCSSSCHAQDVCVMLGEIKIYLQRKRFMKIEKKKNHQQQQRSKFQQIENALK